MNSLPEISRPGWAAVFAVTLALAIALFGALGATATPVLALTPTPPPTSTPTPEPTLVWTFSVSPASPVVGDDIKLTAYASGSGGLPQYTLVLEDSPPVVILESSSSVVPGSMLGVPASWDLGTLAQGEAHFHIRVNYEREFCLPTHCFFGFTNDDSPQMTFDVAPAAVGGVALDAGLRGFAAQDGGAPWLWAALGFGAIAALSALAIARRQRA